MTLEELKAKAKKLNIEFDDDVTEDDLKGMIESAEDEEKNKNKPVSREELEASITYYKKEFEKAKDKRDKANSTTRQLKGEYEKLKTTVDKFPDAEELAAIREELETLRKEKKEIDKKAEELKLSKKTEYEREIYAKEKEKSELEKELDRWKTEKESLEIARAEEEKEYGKKIKALRKRNLEAEIMTAASNGNAWNAKQVAGLTKDEFIYDEDLDKYVHIERGKNGKIENEQDVDEFITDFLSREENENLIRSNMNTTSLNTDKTKTKTSSSKGKIGEYSPTDPEIIKRAELEGMEPERYIKVILNNPKRKQETE